MQMTVLIAQLRPEKGRYDRNVARLGEVFAQAKALEVEEEDLSGPDDESQTEAESESESGWQEEKPMTEAEAEAEQARMDLLLDRIEARIEREGADADFEQIMAEERERLRLERGEPPPPADWEREGPDLDEIFAQAEEEVRNTPEWEREERMTHPLVEQATEIWERLLYLSRQEDWVADDAMAEHPINALITSVMTVGPKLAGALNGEKWPPDMLVAANTLVRLKRARGYIDDALLAAESCQEEKLIEPKHLGPTTVDLIDLAHEIDKLIAELRDRLGDAGAGPE